jgi:hypothetical protein
MYFEYFEWIVLGLVAWSLVIVSVLMLMRMAGDQDRNARRAEQRMIPHSDVTITSISW